MKVIDYKEQYTSIKPGEYFLLLDDDEWFVCIGRSLKNNRLLSYYNIFTSDEVNDDFEQRVFSREMNVKPENVRTLVCSYDLFLAYNRHSIVKGLKHCLDNPDDEHSKNFYHIRKEVQENGGKCIKTLEGDEVYFLGATSTDEDYYYIYVDADYHISCSSCVGKFGTVLPHVPKKLKKFYSRESDVYEKVSQKLFDAIIKKLYGEPEVFFTDIHYDFFDKYALPNLKLMNMILEI